MNEMQPVTIKSLIASESVQSRFNNVLGKKSNAFVSSLMSAVRANKMLQESEPQSLISSAMIAATLDLPITPSLGMAHIVPYRNNRDGVVVAQFQIGWKGLIQLALRTGAYKTMNATVVYEGQMVNFNPFTGEYEFQVEKTSDKPIGYLFYFKLVAGFEKYTYMTVEEAQAHAQKYSASFRKSYGNWVEDFDSMALKTTVKQGLSKWGLLSSEMQTAVVYDQAAIIDGEVDYPDNTENEDEARAAAAARRTQEAMDKVNEQNGRE